MWAEVVERIGEVMWAELLQKVEWVVIVLLVV